MKKITRWRDAIGKKIEEIDYYDNNFYVTLEDGTFIVAHASSGYDGDISYDDYCSDFDIVNDASPTIREIGIVTQEEIDKERNRRDAIYKENQAESERRTYLRLKSKFEAGTK